MEKINWQESHGNAPGHEVKHSPLPFHLSSKCQSCGSTTIAYEMNPKVIVAVNSHEALVDALKLARETISGLTTREFKGYYNSRVLPIGEVIHMIDVRLHNAQADLNEAKIAMKTTDANRHTRALSHLIAAFDAFVTTTNCAVSIREGKKPKAARA